MASQRPTDGASDADAAASGTDRPLPPGPGEYPLVGSTVRLVRDPFGFYDALAEYGDVVRFRALGKSFTTLLHPAYVERVLVEEPWRFERWEFTDVGLEFAPEGLLASDYEQWRRQRQVMQPAFTMERVRSYADTMAGLADRTAREWADGQELDLVETFSALSLRILSNALFDVDVDPDGGDAAIPRAARLINERSGPGSNLSMMLPDWLPTPANRRYERAMDAYRERVTELADQRRREDATGDDLLSLLLAAEGPEGATLSETEVRDNLLTFMFAGHETTALALAYTFLLVSQHDDVAATLQGELETVLDGDRPGFEHVGRLEYTERVVREAMRLYPPVFILFREATEDAVVGGYRIPEGTILTLPQFRLHSDGRFYEDPEAFRPERWAADRERPEFAYFPFGGGPRHCIGMRFAMLELKLVVATLARRFDVTLLSDPDPEVTPGATLRPANPVRVRVHER